MDTDGDGKLQTAEVAAASRHRVAVRGAGAEAMVRSFDVDGDGAVTAADVRELMRHFGGARGGSWRRRRKTLKQPPRAPGADAGKARRQGKYKR